MMPLHEEEFKLGGNAAPNKGASAERNLEECPAEPQLETKSHKGKKITEESRWETTNI